MVTFFIIFGLFFAISLTLLLLFAWYAIFLVNQAEAIIIERLGRFDRVLKPGLHMIIPFIERVRTSSWSFIQDVDGKRHYRFTKVIYRLDLRESVYDFPKQNVITKDNVTMEISALACIIKLLILKLQFTKLQICLKQLKNLLKQLCVMLLALWILMNH